MVLAPPQTTAPTPVVPVTAAPPKTGNAGLFASSATNPVVIALTIVFLIGMLALARVLTRSGIDD